MSVKYCERCKNLHGKEELCSDLKNQLQNDPNLISEAMNFTNLAAQHQLISTQALDGVAMSINKIANTGLTFEGSKQCARDIQVFQQLNVDAFKNSGVFNEPKLAQRYVQSGGTSIENNLKRKLTGTAQEVDWLRNRKGSLTRIFEKAKLVGEETANAPGIDGMVKNRITGKESGVSVKNSISNKGLGTNVRDVLKAIDNGFYNSTFSNVTYNNEKDEYESFIKWIVTKNDKFTTTIEGCLFNNIKVIEGFVIELTCYEKIKDVKLKIENCIFKNCESKNDRIIKLHHYYKPRFSKNIQRIILGTEKNNVGINN